MAKKYEFKPLITSSPSEDEKAEQVVLKAVNVRAAIPGDLHQHLASFVYYHDYFTSHEEVIIRALSDYLKDEPNKPLPAKILNRAKRGRKPGKKKSI